MVYHSQQSLNTKSRSMHTLKSTIIVCISLTTVIILVNNSNGISKTTVVDVVNNSNGISMTTVIDVVNNSNGIS